MTESVIGVVAGAFGAAALILGLILATVGLYGMLRKPEIFEQLHAAGLVTGPGVILVLLASLATWRAEIVTSALLVVGFVLVTSSLSTHAIALAAWHLRQGTSAGARLTRAARDEPDAAGASLRMRVLVAHDGSPGGSAAVALAAAVPWPSRSLVRMIGAIEGDLPGLPAAASTDGAVLDRADLIEVLEAAAAALRRPGIRVDTALRSGNPANAIADEAATLEADLVIVGSRGLGALERLLLGSVATAVADAAACPVLVARRTSVSKVLLAVDETSASDAAVDLVAQWPIFDGISVRVLNVATGVPQYGDLPPAADMPEAIETARHGKVADGAAKRLIQAGRAAVPLVMTGDTAARIVEVAETDGIDLIVLGSRGHTGLRRAWLGSVGRVVLSSTSASVLIVKPRQDHAGQSSAEL